MTLEVSPPAGTSLSDFLGETELIHWSAPQLSDLANELRVDDDLVETAAACFFWVRDNVLHSSDHRRNPVTCSAADVLEHRTGYCYAKGHLLAALLRANGIPAGFCYQRLAMDESGRRFCLHGLNAVYLEPHGWYRVDARGERADITTDFCPPREKLVFAPELAGEYDLPEIWPDPLDHVVNALRQHDAWDEMLEHLPDVKPPA